MWTPDDVDQLVTRQQVRTEASPPRLALLTAIVSSPSDCNYVITSDLQTVRNWMARHLKRSSIVAFDIETRGTEPHLPDSKLVGFSLATGRESIYINLINLDVAEWVLNRLAQLNCRVIAHNLMFDGAWVYEYWPEVFDRINWRVCTYLAYKLTAAEGWAGQRWGLKDAQVELLGWTNTNEVDLDQWLVANAYVTGAVSNKFREEYTPEQRVHEYLHNNRKAGGGTKFSPDKSEMWRAPAEILGKYCCLDTYSTLLLWDVLRPVVSEFRALDSFIRAFMVELRLLIKQKCRGISVDVAKLEETKLKWEYASADALAEFESNPEVAELINAYNQEQMQINYYTKEPSKYRKDGTPSKTWTNWAARYDQVFDKCKFNINSNQQLCWLFYDKLGYEVAKHTESGAASIDKSTLHKFGTPGRLLADYNRIEKELGYINAAVTHTHAGVMHPGFRVPGTLTGRLSGSGGINLQQVPKVRDYLECYRARPGYKWVQCDVNSLEKVVLAELSRDPAMLNLFGPGAKPNDQYLFDGAHLPGFKETILAAGYEPFNTTAEMVARVKQECASTRKKVKPASLGFQYGMGPKKYRATMASLGIHMTEDEAYQVWRAYWDLYAGVKEYERELLRQWNKNNGWILNGVGRPLGIHADYTRDIINRQCQSTGHDLLVYWINIFARQLDESGIEWHPIILDFHDESIIEVRESDAPRALEILTGSAFDELNERMGNLIPLAGDGLICDNLAEVKIED